MTTDLDLALLRRYEPIIRFTQGEQFFPMDAETYIRASSLWVQRPGQEAERLVESGDLDPQRLAQPSPDEFGAVHFLKLTDPLRPREMAAYTLRGARPTARQERPFRAGRGRLARVGYGSRIVDALFSLSLLTRGRVPGDLAAASAIAYQEMLQHNEEYTYHGRVVRQDGWVVLQYWFFYLYNNWRSGFSGANDHESDWEMVCIYLSEEESDDSGVFTGPPTEAGFDAASDDLDPHLMRYNPEWIAYASHDYSGDDLRRRWDDPELELLHGHPVIYAGAGSHASYFSAGEYLTELQLPLLAPLVKLNGRIQDFWHGRLRQYAGEGVQDGQQRVSNIFLIPFVDYARGDGRSIGPGQECAWDEPVLLSPPPGWVSGYRGLWGLYARDPFAGEDAPAGPMYNRDGSVRHSWYDPLGWAGLDKVPPPDEELARVGMQQDEIKRKIAAQAAEIAQRSRDLQAMGIESESMRDQPHLHGLYVAHQEQMGRLSRELNSLRGQVTQDETLLGALGQYEARLARGEHNPVRAHIGRAHSPASDDRRQAGRVAEIWAALSVGLMLIGFVSLAVFATHYLIFGLVAILALFTFIEAGFRGRLVGLIASVTIALAIVAGLVLLYEFFWQTVFVIVLIVGLYILWDNLRELTR